MMSYWTFSDVFEEQGVVKQPLYGGYGLIAENDLPKPSFNAFKLLHDLGDQRITVDSQSALVTRRSNGAIAIAIWNLYLPGETGEEKRVTLRIEGSRKSLRAKVFRLDHTHGSLLQAYAELGQPKNPTKTQIEELRTAARLPPPEMVPMSQNRITIVLPPHGLALIELR